MIEIGAKLNLPLPAAKLWKIVGDFNGMANWHPLVEHSALEVSEGRTLRHLRLFGGGSLVERLESHDPEARAYSYSIVESDLPLIDYVATIGVSEAPGGCSVYWQCSFEALANADEIERHIRDVIDAGFARLRDDLNP